MMQLNATRSITLIHMYHQYHWNYNHATNPKISQQFQQFQQFQQILKNSHINKFEIIPQFQNFPTIPIILTTQNNHLSTKKKFLKLQKFQKNSKSSKKNSYNTNITYLTHNDKIYNFFSKKKMHLLKF